MDFGQEDRRNPSYQLNSYGARTHSPPPFRETQQHRNISRLSSYSIQSVNGESVGLRGYRDDSRRNSWIGNPQEQSISSSPPQSSANSQHIHYQMSTRPGGMSHRNDSRFSDLHPGTPSGAQTPTTDSRPGTAGWSHQYGSVLSLHSPGPGTPFNRSTEMLNSLLPEEKRRSGGDQLINNGYGAQILKLADADDDGRISLWRTLCLYLAPIFAVLTLASYWIYFILRIMYVQAAQNKQGSSLPMAWAFIGIEITVAVPIFLQMFWMMFIWKKRTRPRLRLQGDIVPTVDVIITCCKEDVDLITDTARAACELDYPSNRFRVTVLDDGSDPLLRESIQHLGERYPNLHYRARIKIKGQPHHFKAGNLNYGITETADMPGGGAELIAALDADMIPEVHWLRAIIPHLIINPEVALGCPPQLFYNIPKGDPLAQSLDFFVHMVEPIKDALGVAWCTGSGYVVRREALMQIDGFPVGGLAEDVYTSTLLLGKGWKTAYVHEPLQFGTVPEDFSSHLKQRTRWAIGTIDTALKLKFCLWGERVRHMKFWPRLSGFIYATTAMFNIFLLISLFALPVVLLSGRPIIAYATDKQLHTLIYSAFATVVISRMGEIVMYAPAGYTNGQRDARSHFWMAPYFAISVLRAFVLPSWLGGQAHSFKPTGSLKSEINERDSHTRAPMWRRLKVITFNYLAIFHVGYVYIILGAVTFATSRCVFSPPAYLFTPFSQIDSSDTTINISASDSFSRAQLQCLLTHAYWPPVAWLLVIASFWMPISYAINPPTMPPREDLLERDPKTDVARAKDQYKKGGWGSRELWYEGFYGICFIFSCIIFVAAFLWI